MMYLGLDLSLNGTGLVCIDNNYGIIKQDKFINKYDCQDGVQRLFHLENRFYDFLSGLSPVSFACLEGPSYQSDGNLFQIGEWTGIAKMVLFKSNINYIVATPSQLKKYISGKFEKGSKKELIILDIYKKYNVEIRDNDIADAYVMSRLAHDYFFKYIKKDIINVYKYQEEVLEKIYDVIHKIDKMNII